MNTENISLFYAANIYTAQGNNEQIITDAAIVVAKGIIIWLGEKSTLPKVYDSVEVTQSFNNGWITPGLIDCHTHLVYGGNRADEFRKRLEGQSYESIAREGGGIISTVKATRCSSEQELIDSASKRLEGLLAEGVTTIEIKSGYGLDLENEIKMLRAARELENRYSVDIKTTCLAAHALPPEYENRADDYIHTVCESILPAVHGLNLADAVDAFCENIGFTTAQVEMIFNKAQQLGLPVKLHAEQLSNQDGSTLAASYNALSVDHLEYLDENGVKAISESGTVAVLLPGAFYFLRETKLPPINLLRKYKVPIAIATDSNPGSSPCNSLLLMLNMACTQFSMTPDEALMAVTHHAAKALGIADKQGQIKIGQQADFVHWDIEQPEDLAYYFGNNPCLQVFKKGEVVAF